MHYGAMRGPFLLDRDSGVLYHACTDWSKRGPHLRIFLFIIFLLAVLPVTAHAETKVITAEGSYVMGDGETIVLAEARALQQAKRQAVEQAGSYISSYSKTRNFDLTADEVEGISAGVLTTEVLEKKRTLIGDALQVYVKIKATVTTDKVLELVAQIRSKGTDYDQLVRNYKDMQTQYGQLSAQIDSLKQQLAQADTDEKKRPILFRLTTAERRYLARTFYDEIVKDLVTPIQTQIQWLSEVIELDPTYSEAWRTRASMYMVTEDCAKAIVDATEAIRYNRSDDSSYALRGYCYAKEGHFQDAIRDMNESIRLNPTYVHLKDRRYINEKFGYYD
jgi:tetratricopeptide (TPR) repeat protein